MLNSVSSLNSFDSRLWLSMRRRKDIKLTNQDMLEFIVLKFVCEDFVNSKDDPIIVTKNMLDEQRKTFEKLVKECEKVATDA